MVGHETDVAVVDQGVGEEQRPTAGIDAEHGVVGADRVHLEGDDVLADLLAEGEAGDRRPVLELVQAGLVAEDRDPEALRYLRGVTQVMAVGEDDPLDAAVLEPLDPLLGQERVDHRSRAGQEVAVHREADARMLHFPVEDAVEDLLHRRPA